MNCHTPTMDPVLDMDLVAEMTVVAGLLRHHAVFGRVSLTIGPEHFHDPLQGYLYDWLVTAFRDGEDIAAIPLIEIMADDELFVALGGGVPSLAAQLACTVPAQAVIAAAEYLAGWRE